MTKRLLLRPGTRLMVVLTLVAIVAGMAPAGVAAPSEVTVVGLEADAAATPLGIDNPRPRLSWRSDSTRRGVRQTAAEVLVASSPKLLTPQKADVWKSGRIAGSRPFLDYAGPKLTSRTRYFWTVRIWDDKNGVTAWARSTWFETAFLDPDEWRAKWIKGPRESCSDDGARDCPAPLLRTEFDLTGQVAAARLYASGLSYGVYEINGRRVGNAVLDPGITDYTERVFYVTHDVTEMVHSGGNAIGAELGRGFMGMVGPTYAGYPGAWRSEPVLRLEYTDGTSTVVRSGDGWRTDDSPRRFDDAAWGAATVVAGPSGVTVAQDQEPIRPKEQLPFASVTETQPGVYLFDLGRNVAGNVILDLDLAPGQKISVHYAEKLTEDRRPDLSGNPDYNGGTIQLDEYIGGAGPDRWRPEFTYKGLQWVEITGLSEPPPLNVLTAEVWHSDVAAAGTWRSSHGLANRIVGNTERAVLSNLYSHPTDTPVYEKSGYTGDAQIMAPSMAYLFDMRRFLSKWSTDIRQALTAAGPTNPGMAMRWVAPSPETEPVADGSPVTPGWDAALFVVPDVVRQYYGDERPARDALPEMRRYLDIIRPYAPGGTITGEEVPEPLAAFSRFGLGDWAKPCKTSASTDGSEPLRALCLDYPSKGISLDSTAWYHEMLRIYADVAEDAGDQAAASDARAEARRVRTAFDSRFFDPISDAYQDLTGQNLPAPPEYSQHVNAVALGLDVALPERRQAAGGALARDVTERGGHNYTGIMGTRFFWPALTGTGHLDEAWAAATKTGYPSYGYWIEELGWTSLGERWEGDTRSRNHHMFGTVVQWLFEDIAGYRPAAPGFAEIEFAPHVPSAGLDWVRAATDTVRGGGEVASCWERTPNGLALDVTVPANSTGVVRLPWADANSVSEVGAGKAVPAGSAEGVRLRGVEDGRVVYEVGSGTYRFRAGDAASQTINHCS